MDFSQLTDAQIVALLNDPRFMTAVSVLAIWVLIWKGIALWKASQNKSKKWFVALLVLNTLGILEITYIFYFSKKKSLSSNSGKFPEMK